MFFSDYILTQDESLWILFYSTVQFHFTTNQQKKIGIFLKNLDKLITLHERELAHLQTQKKALLQQMFV